MTFDENKKEGNFKYHEKIKSKFEILLLAFCIRGFAKSNENQISTFNTLNDYF